MMASETEPFILHRLSLVGWAGNPKFTPESFSGIYEATDGVPRRINALASRVMLLGAIDKLNTIDGDVVEAVIADMAHDEEEASRPATTAPSSREPAPAAMAVSSAEQIEQAADEVENRNKADERHMEAPRFASATPHPTRRGTEALERLSNLEARVEEQERAIRIGRAACRERGGQ